MVQKNIERAEATTFDELIEGIAEFADKVIELADYATKADNPQCDYIEYLRTTKARKRRNRRI
jgi:hypothetical protein